MPAMQQIYFSVSQLRYHRGALDALIHDMRLPPALPPAQDMQPLSLRHALQVENISYAYPSRPPVLHSVSLTIPRNGMVGFAGASGAGKTTLIDIFLGLLTPTEGVLKADGVTITPENVRAWQASLGYVPQQIYLVDDTIAANIAFGVSPDRVDAAQVERAARLAHLHQFIGTLPDGYATIVGERGVRLSGGQRQRIGIARALYMNPEIVILDEATNALDNVTENAVMEAIRELAGKKTIILIAHRLATLRGCDCIYVMDHGRIVDSGTYDGLMQHSAAFRRLASGRQKEAA
jgi:ABC-type multidrug transport system fused ATPase/permease subunit